MANFEIRIPQLGEGLQEARIVRFLKEPGDQIAQDEIIYEMETDKAVMEIESPVSGTLQAWTAQEDDVVPIGEVIGTIATGAVSMAQPVPEPTPEYSPSVQEKPTDENIIELKIPQLGEGLQEARIVQFLKEPGEAFQRDEPIYEMETDKAVMEIESPVAGTIIEWMAKVDDVVEIGAVIARVSGAGAETVNLTQPSHSASSVTSVTVVSKGTETGPVPFTGKIRNGQISPRTHSHALAKGISDNDLIALAQSVDGKLLPLDIDNYLAAGKSIGSARPSELSRSASAPVKSGPETFVDEPLPTRQKTLNFRLQRSAQSVIPATMEMPLNWSAVEAARTQVKEANGTATQFVMFAWCVAQATKDHPRFRAALINDGTLRQYDHLHLGIAVALPDDILLMARVADADTLDFDSFVSQARKSVGLARDGKDQTTDVMQLSLTNMASAGVRTGFPVVVAPSVGTIFIGTPYDEAYRLPSGEVGFRRMANLVFTFDHRVANGIGAARFLGDIRDRVENFRV